MKKEVFLVIAVLFIIGFLFQADLTGEIIYPFDISQDSSVVFGEAKLVSNKNWQWCVDGDGKNYNEYGKLKAQYKYKKYWRTRKKTNRYEDYCLKDNILREYFCSGKKPYYIDYKCENGCNKEKRICKEKPIDCKEAIPNHNNLSENRINLVFIGYNYDINEFKQIVSGIIINNEGSSEIPTYWSKGLFSESPFDKYKDRFNVWYINKIYDLKYNEDEDFYYVDKNLFRDDILLSDSCNLDNIEEIFLMKKAGELYDKIKGGTYAQPGEFAFITDSRQRPVGDDFDLKNLRAVVIHELGHSFGFLADEYIYPESRWQSIPSKFYYTYEGTIFGKNCDTVLNGKPCSDWCENNIEIDIIKNYDCSIYNSGRWFCFKEGYSHGCGWSHDKDICVNTIKNCGMNENKEDCESYDELLHGCMWVGDFGYENNLHPYYESACLPHWIYTGGINFEKNCLDSTSCYRGCSSLSYFHSNTEIDGKDETTIMGGKMFPFGLINENLLIKRIGEVTSPSLKKALPLEKPNIILYDDFEDGEIVSGGLIDLDNPILKEELTKRVSERLLPKGAVGKIAKINLTEIPISMIIEEYEKLIN